MCIKHFAKVQSQLIKWLNFVWFLLHNFTCRRENIQRVRRQFWSMKVVKKSISSLVIWEDSGFLRPANSANTRKIIYRNDSIISCWRDNVWQKWIYTIIHFSSCDQLRWNLITNLFGITVFLLLYHLVSQKLSNVRTDSFWIRIRPRILGKR